MTKDEIWTVIDATSCSPKEKNRLKIAVDYYSRALLQQTDCSTLREFILQKMKGDQLFADAQPLEASPTYYDGKIVAYQNVLKLIDELQPVA